MKIYDQEYIKSLDCGIRYASIEDLQYHYPHIYDYIKATFPENPYHFSYCVKVHMLMPNQWPCIPNWHRDAIPLTAKGRFKKAGIDTTKSIYLWVSNDPSTEFKEFGFIKPREWFRFTQLDEHRGTASTEHIWRLCIRATHNHILKLFQQHDECKVCKVLLSYKPKHSQVYLDAANFEW